MHEVLLILLIYRGGKGIEGGEYVVAYREGLLSGWREGRRESDAVELGGTGSIFQCLPRQYRRVKSLPVGVIFDSLVFECRRMRIFLVPHL